MPAEPNPVKRAVITAIVAGVGLLVCIAVLLSSAPKSASPAGSSSAPTAAAPAQPPAPTPTAPTPAPSSEPAPAEGQAGAEPRPEAAQPPAPLATGPAALPAPTLVARLYPADEPFAPIGSIDAGSPWEAKIEFSDYGAGVEAITLTDYFESWQKGSAHYAVQRRVEHPQFTAAGAPAPAVVVTSLAAVGLDVAFVDEQGRVGPASFMDLRIPPGGMAGRFWRQTGPGAFEAEALGSASPGEEPAPLLRVRKRYVLREGALDFTLEQKIENVSGRPLQVTFYQYGPTDLPPETTGYGIDVRRLRWGYLQSPERDPSGQWVLADRRLLGRGSVIKPAEEANKIVWPTPSALRQADRLSWLAMSNRYFAFSVHPPIDPQSAAAAAAQAGATLDKQLSTVQVAHRVIVGPRSTDGSIVLQLTSPPTRIEAGATADVSLGVYAGPKSRARLTQSPVTDAVGLGQLIVYNLGGPCAMCTFQWLAYGLIWFLRVVHSLAGDWAIAIIALVFCVRAALHPLTRRSQIALARFSKQMAGLAPKQQALREKHKDDPKKMQQEMARLMKEEGINFSGALGCLPIFLQMPVWIALYAMLFFAFELRHEPAFYGVFQAVSGGSWGFLADLAAPDHFVEFGRTFNIPLLSGLLGPISGINILPLLLGVVFFVQQKYLTPPPSTALTPEQELQQKMMKWIMVILFPLMMYNAPSGLSVYFITNSTLGILESRWIRAHINTLDLTSKKPGSEKGGFLQKVMAEAQRRAESKSGGAAGGAKRGAPQQPANPFAKRREQSAPKYKKRER